jgi:hypothetical protein
MYCGGYIIGGAARSSPRLNRSRTPRYVMNHSPREATEIPAEMIPGIRKTTKFPV